MLSLVTLTRLSMTGMMQMRLIQTFLWCWGKIVEPKKKHCRAARYTRACSLGLVLSAVPFLADAAQKMPLAATAPGQTELAQSRLNFDIAGQSLETALDEFITVSGWQLGYPTRLVKGVTTRGVTGSMSAQEAISQLLAGSGLVANISAPGVATLAEESAVVLAPITVTAQRIEEEAQKVPISLEVTSAEEIEEKGYERLSQVLARTVNVGVPHSGSYYLATPVIRGIGNEIPFTDPAVSTFIDGAPMPGGLSDFDLHNVERVEIMRGPQSTLFGQNSLAGAVNVVMKPAPKKGWSAQAKGKYGSDKHYGASAVVQAALVEDKFGVRLATNRSQIDGHVKNTTTGHMVGERENKSLRMIVDTTPSDDLDVSFTYEHRNDIGGQVDSVVVRDSYSYRGPNTESKETSVSDGVVGKLKWFQDQYEIVSQTGFRTLNLDYLSNSARSGGISIDVDTDETYFFQELRLVSPKENSDLGWQTGIYFADESFDVTQKTDTLLADPSWTHKRDTRRYEAFGQVDYDVLKNWTLTLGGRVSKVKHDVVHNYVRPTTAIPVPRVGFVPLAAINDNVDASRSFSNAVGRIALNYAISPRANAYVSLNQGFKAGNARSNAVTRADIFTPKEDLFLPSEKATTGEIGTKLQFHDTTLNAAAFYTDYKNRHTFLASGLNAKILAVPKANAWGGELAIDQKILEGWSAFGRVGYLQSEFADFTITTGIGALARDFKIGGHEFRAAPTWTGSLGSRFEDSFADGWNYFVTGDVTYQSDSYGNIFNANTNFNKAHSLVNAGLGVRKEHVSFSVNATNIFDTYYYTNTSQSTDGGGVPGAPARFTAALTIDLGP